MITINATANTIPITSVGVTILSRFASFIFC